MSGINSQRSEDAPFIYLALRFHTNFYHSYRGDTPDELGFGKDIRIVTSILNDLDRLNAEGIPVNGTWDIENYYSLEQLIPKYAPELLERLQKRVAEGRDTVSPMSYNNGIVSACTEEEFQRIAEWTIKNPENSGLADLFSSWEPVVRPQECMYTPSFLRLYPQHGIKAISLYYSSHPFNGFSNFMPLLPFEQRYNPLTLKADGVPGEMVLLPMYNNGDIADHWLSLKYWLNSMRREQLRLKSANDLLLLIDMDADDDFWFGMDIPVLPKLFPSFGGLYSMIKSIAGLPWLRFTTPGEYLNAHAPLGEISLNQDTADGSFDGLSSWAEKWTNTDVWSQIQRARILSDYASFLMDNESISPDVTATLDEGLTARLLAMSTTHFGLTSPIMNARRLETAYEWSGAALHAAENALRIAARHAECTDEMVLMPGAILDEGVGEGALVRFHSAAPLPPHTRLVDETGNTVAIPFSMEPLTSENHNGTENATETAFVCRNTAKSLKLILGDVNSSSENALDITTDENRIANRMVSVRASADTGVELFFEDKPITRKGSPAASVRYDGKLRITSHMEVNHHGFLSQEAVQFSIKGCIPLDEGQECCWSHRYILVSELPYIFLDVLMKYPETEHKNYDEKLAKRLGAAWDARWQEVMPWEFAPILSAPLTIWKHNFFGDTTHYRLNYGEFSPNRGLDSFNNHITNGWIAVNGKEGGILLAQSCLWDNSFAFCPMRLRQEIITLNPFGAYHGKQLKYPSATTGLGRMLSLNMADHLKSYAPSYNGKTSRFSLMIAPYRGETPPTKTRNDAMLFSTPPIAMETQNPLL
ncbi:MAG TPA: hypothetical protein PLI09_14415 [Candidatus Hydrogenedentes bacterium]|nr:hypothetical protein [Candidatus Hydrogenedentota bacterium]